MNIYIGSEPFLSTVQLTSKYTALAAQIYGKECDIQPNPMDFEPWRNAR